MSEFSEKIKHVNIAGKRSPKVTVDVHDNHEVEVTEHWADRMDVTVRPPTIAVTTTVSED